MYESFFNLRERPFDLTPNPRFLFMTPAHEEALSTISYGISGRKGLTLLLGPPGTGKTTLVRAAIERSQGEHARLMCLTNPVISREEFFEFLADELGVPHTATASKPRFLSEVRAVLQQRHDAGIVTSLIIDEAQALPDELLEEVRLLENLEIPSGKLLPVVLVGQVELGERLRHPSLVALKQRIALRSTLAPLSAHGTAQYIGERIRIAGGNVNEIFDPAAVAAIADACGGIPRIISVVCDNALVSGFALNQKPVGAQIISEVCRDFDLPAVRPVPTPVPPRSAMAPAAAADRPSAPSRPTAGSAPTRAVATTRAAVGSTTMRPSPTARTQDRPATRALPSSAGGTLRMSTKPFTPLVVNTGPIARPAPRGLRGRLRALAARMAWPFTRTADR